LPAARGTTRSRAAPGPTPSCADTIVEFAQGDRIALDNEVFLDLGADGALAAAAFRSGSGAHQAGAASHRVIFDTAGGGLYFDADGAGGAPSMQIALLQSFGGVAATDILVV
jgi:Ca2+-binding RTX toxin-like protein